MSEPPFSQLLSEEPLITLYTVRIHSELYILYLFVNLLSFGLLSVIIKWVHRVPWYYVNCVKDKATHVLIVEKNLCNNNIDRWAIEFENRKYDIYEMHFNDKMSIEMQDRGKKRKFEKHDIFEFKCERFVFLDGRFISVHKSHPLMKKNKLWTGYSTLEVEQMQYLFGPNHLNLPETTLFELFINEIVHPFNVFQMFSIALWLWDEYYYYSFCILMATLLSMADTLWQTRRNQKRMRSMCDVPCQVNCTRDGQWVTISSEKLVPGDVIQLPHDKTSWKIPCDMVIVQSSCFVNESELTGESVPISKTSISTSDWSLNDKVPVKHLIFHGTTLVSTRKAIAVVVATGFSTSKGQLIRSVMYPPPSTFKFYSDAIQFVLILSVFAFIGFGISLYPLLVMTQNHIHWASVVKRALDMFTIVVPPALPATMSVGTVNALRRLKKKAVTCIAPSKVNVAGKVDCVVFDKTGTLTTDELTLFSHWEVDASSDLWKKCLSTCHSLGKLEDDLIGDTMDKILFQSTAAKLFDNGTTVLLNGENLEIVHVFEFLPSLRRITVVVKMGNEIWVFSKGAPESISILCDTIPNDYNFVLNKFTTQGYRVISLAGAKIEQTQDEWKRELFEKNLKLIGIVALENKIKPDAFKVMKCLNDAQISRIISTGDNVKTACSVARVLNLLDSQSPLVLGEMSNGSLIWKDENHNIQTSPSTQIALTGDAFEFIYYQVKQKKEPMSMLLCCHVYSRMSPDQKRLLIQFLREFGYSTMMVGDGSNDCSALKAADIGLSLSEADASIAAPFTSKKSLDILGVILLITEGRASLVTSFGCFKYMAIYSLVQFTTVILSYFRGSTLSDFQFLYIDLVLVLPLAVTMSYSAPLSQISVEKPLARLMSFTVVISIFGHVFVQILFQLIALDLGLLDSSSLPLTISPDFKFANSAENSSLFLFSTFLYLTYSVLFSLGYPFRESIYKNRPFGFFIFIATVLNLGLLWFRPSFVGIVELDVKTLIGILFLAIFHLLLGIVLEKNVFIFISNWAERRMAGNHPLRGLFGEHLRERQVSMEQLL